VAATAAIVEMLSTGSPATRRRALAKLDATNGSSHATFSNSSPRDATSPPRRGLTEADAEKHARQQELEGMLGALSAPPGTLSTKMGGPTGNLTMHSVTSPTQHRHPFHQDGRAYRQPVECIYSETTPSCSGRGEDYIIWG
jgi:hypothetical protein